MKVYQIEQYGHPDGLRMSDRRTPEPKPGEVVVRIKAASLNYRDLVVLRGQYERDPKPGKIPLSDGAGEVIAVGPNVEEFKPGDRVAGCFFQTWTAGRFRSEMHQAALGGPIDGVLAEEVIFSAKGLVPVPPDLSFEEAATLPCAALTAWHSMVVCGGLQPGGTVLLLGTGGVSIFALQLAKKIGFHAIITSGSDEKMGRARQLGADAGINYRKDTEWGATAARLSGQGGVDHVVEVGGAGTFPQSMKACRPGASIGLIGILAGRENKSELFPLVGKLLHVHGIYVGSREMFQSMNLAIAKLKLKPMIDRVFSFAEAPAAYRYMESGSHFAKVVIQVPD